jgi:hypothetical protein
MIANRCHLLSLILLGAVIGGSACSSSTSAPPPKPVPGSNPDSGTPPPPTGQDSGPPPPAPDAGPAGDAQRPDMDMGPTPDAGPDAYIPPGTGPFGLAARPSNATCKPPAKYLEPVMLLSATGCVDPQDPGKPAPGMIPYDVASPLWSDGASKERFMSIPDGTLIHVKDCMREPDTCKPTAQGGTSDDDGHLGFPLGTVLMKNFLFQKKSFETRLFVKYRDDFWVGYSYIWNAQHTDATIAAEDGVTMPVMNDSGMMQSWYFPSRSDCLLCHNKSVGFSLGPETQMLNIDYAYPGGVKANQLATLEHIGMFDGPVKRIAPLPNPASGIMGMVNDPATAVVRARSYMHANCAICHRPEGDYPDIDLRFGVDLKAMNLCNVDPNKGTLTITPPTRAKRLVPGNPQLSVTYLRTTTLDEKVRMPQIATSIVDPVGTRLISDWIKGITACPP